MKPEVSGHIFEKYSNIKFHEKPSIGWMDGRTDGLAHGHRDRRREGHGKANVRFTQFCKRALKEKSI